MVIQPTFLDCLVLVQYKPNEILLRKGDLVLYSCDALYFKTMVVFKLSKRSPFCAPPRDMSADDIDQDDYFVCKRAYSHANKVSWPKTCPVADHADTAATCLSMPDGCWPCLQCTMV